MSKRTTIEQFLGRWRITEMSMWGSDALDLGGPACIEFEPDGMGAIHFIAARGGIDYRASLRGGRPLVEFTWEGMSEGDPISGRATATLHDRHLTGTLFIHLGDESSFMARRWERTDAR